MSNLKSSGLHCNLQALGLTKESRAAWDPYGVSTKVAKDPGVSHYGYNDKHPEVDAKLATLQVTDKRILAAGGVHSGCAGPCWRRYSTRAVYTPRSATTLQSAMRSVCGVSCALPLGVHWVADRIPSDCRPRAEANGSRS